MFDAGSSNVYRMLFHFTFPSSEICMEEQPVGEKATWRPSMELAQNLARFTGTAGHA